MIDYEKLAEDLNDAKKAAVDAAKGEDGGSCNSDTMYLRLPRAREAKVIEAAEKAGLHARKGDYFGTAYFVYPPECGQAESRYRAVQAMKRVMTARGWDANVFYYMD